jgi:hypothetical protein
MRSGLLLSVLCLAISFGSAQRQPAPVFLETPSLRFEISPGDGSYRLTDKAGGVVWRSNASRFGEVAVQVDGKTQRFALTAFDAGRDGNALVFTFHPIAGKPEAWVRVKARTGQDQRTVELSYEAPAEVKVESIRLLDDAFAISNADKGYVVVPVREGLLIPSDSGLSFSQRFGTSDYNGCHMEMLGLVKSGAAMLVTWSDPYVVAEVKSAAEPSAGGPAAQTLSTSLVLSKSARWLRVQALGKGDYVTIAKAYREVARQNGYLVTWAQKLKGHPERAKYFGASNVKLWQALDRRMNEESTQEVRVRVNWTFDEAAQVAEHLKRDLKLDKVLFGLGGFSRRGYDNQHPDILPAAAELGGNAGLTDCARRVQALGYLFALHDNYQDMYRDAPSWDEKWIMKAPDGGLVRGGIWAGGRAYITCSREAVKLAQRPQNLPAVKQSTNANSYFIDTTYAAGLYECFDPNHPLTKVDDIKWKQAISDYAREVFGSFGSEDGREWAIPHSDFFEGLTGVSGYYLPRDRNTDQLKATGGVMVPMFELVYRDCIAMYGKYGYNINNAAEYVLYHLMLGRPLNYHSIPNHVYWQNAPSAAEPTPGAGLKDAALFVPGENGWTQGLHPADRFLKNTHEILSPLNEITSRLPMTGHQFLTADRKAQRSVFGEGSRAVEVVVNVGDAPLQWRSKTGGDIELPPYGFLVEGPTFVAFRAQNWSGHRYASAPLFTMRSLDGKPLSESRRIQVYHGFGDAELPFGGVVKSVVKEAVLER